MTLQEINVLVQAIVAAVTLVAVVVAIVGTILARNAAKEAGDAAERANRIAQRDLGALLGVDAPSVHLYEADKGRGLVIVSMVNLGKAWAQAIHVRVVVGGEVLGANSVLSLAPGPEPRRVPISVPLEAYSREYRDTIESLGPPPEISTPGAIQYRQSLPKAELGYPWEVVVGYSDDFGDHVARYCPSRRSLDDIASEGAAL